MDEQSIRAQNDASVLHAQCPKYLGDAYAFLSPLCGLSLSIKTCTICIEREFGAAQSMASGIVG